MTSDWDHLQDAFARLQTLTQAEREHGLEVLFAQDPAFAEQLQRLLTAADQDLSLSGSVADAVDNLLNAGHTNRKGEVIGVFRLEERIGAGGMGVVYRASRIDGFEQTVAIKFLNTVVHNTDLVERFASERQILARLEHPYIARLIDGGTADDGEPFLVMEYVPGQTLTEFCKSKELKLKQRLRLFARILQAVDFAHRTLVIHRDLKPSNILITNDGVPRLLDFGIADLLSQDGEQTNTVIGLTPEYASPEQLNHSPVTIATDVYSLGVLLYQLLTDQLPHNPDPVTAETMRDAVMHQPAPIPSHAKNPPVRLDYELDAIVTRALAQNVDQRYASADSLLRDVQRYLNKQPLAAIGQSGPYRFRKFLMRHSAAAMISAVAVLGLLVLTGLYITNVQQARDLAQTEADKANRIAGFMEQLFEDVDPGETQGSEITAARLLEQGIERIDTDFAGLPEIQVRLRGVIGRTWRRLGDYQNAFAVHSEAGEILAETQLDNPKLRAQVLFDLAYADFELGRLVESLERHQQALELRRQLYPGDHPELADSLRETGLLQQQNQNVESAEALYQEALTMYQRLGRDYLSAQASTLMDLAGVEMSRNNREGALDLAMQSLDAQLELHGEIHPEVATATNNIGIIHNLMGAKEEALRWSERSIDIRKQLYGEDNPITLFAIRNYANLLWGLGRTAQAIPHYRQAHFGQLKATAGEDDVRNYFNVLELIQMLRTVGEVDEAYALALEARQRSQSLPGVSAYQKGYAAETLAQILSRQSNYADAHQLFTEALGYYNETDPLNTQHIQRVNTLKEVSKYQAEPSSEQLAVIVAMVDKQVSEADRLPTETGYYFAHLADFYAAQREPQTAAMYADKMLVAGAQIFDVQSIEFADLQVRGAGLYLAAGQSDKVPQLLNQAGETLTLTQAKVEEEYPLFASLNDAIAHHRETMQAL